MNKVFVAKQKIFDKNNKVFAYELLFRDHKHGIKDFPTNMKATSHVIINAITNISTNELIGVEGVAFINVDEDVLKSDILDILDRKRFVLEILEDTDLTDKVISRIKQYHARGFKIAIDDFDCTSQMIKKFTPILKYVHIVKMDVLEAQPSNLEMIVQKFKRTNIKLLAEKVETKEDYYKYLNMGFDYFQGYYLDEPQVIEVDRYKEATQMVIIQLIKIIKDDGETTAIEAYVRQQPDLSYKLLKFLNNQIKTKVESITQIITMLGRDKLLRWLMLYLYSELSTNPASEAILDIATRRAERLENYASPEDKDKAYLAGMFSMLDAIFETDIKDIIKNVNLDRDISSLVLNKTGKFASDLRKVETFERDYLKKLLIKNFDKISTTDIIYALRFNDIAIDREKL